MLKFSDFTIPRLLYSEMKKKKTADFCFWLLYHFGHKLNFMNLAV